MTEARATEAELRATYLAGVEALELAEQAMQTAHAAWWRAATGAEPTATAVEGSLNLRDLIAGMPMEAYEKQVRAREAFDAAGAQLSRATANLDRVGDELLKAIRRSGR